MTGRDEQGLVIEGLAKAYPGVVALDKVDLAVAAGTVHGLVGENGAGKSTLMKCVAGAEKPDAGSVIVGGRRVEGSVHDAAEAGVAMIYQELTIVPDLTALENVFLGALPTRFGVVRRTEARRAYRRVAAAIGATTRPGTRAGSLSTSAQQQLEIMRAISHDRRVLILDEPTASLGPADIERLHTVIRSLRDRGLAVVYVSHDLEAVLDVCDDVTVLREGRVVTTRPASEWTAPELVAAMVGGVPLVSAGAPRHEGGERPELFRISGLRAPGVDVPSLDVRRGEILGVAGLVGSGRTRMLRAIAGADRVDHGSMIREGRERPWPRHPRQALHAGVMLAPEDRKGQGLVLDRPSAWNVAVGRFAPRGAGAPVTASRIRRWAGPFAESVGFAPDRLTAAAGTLSGGNQQKLLLGRLLGRGVSCLLLDEPTRGIDVGAKAQIFRTIRDLVDAGHAVIWSSSDLSEVAQHSDRIVVVAGGRVVAELPKGASVPEILAHAFAATATTEGAAA
ncbi:sugar ABC transporter ATP-binding protein [Leifsonia sp. AG29]|uniref:sugar ABC transporter ATP-binding protein n=1 Tax=Leifsonia sp. AG29 TaxID=2598860 RepID=UPI00131BFF2D|nr:sugar ABC transporter ATP-binding protein [Leifsonia sp. AG29]